MKSIKQLQQEMANIQVQISTEDDLSTPAINKLKKRYSFLKLCIMYLEEKPTIEFLDKEKDRLTNRVNLINAGYEPDKRLIASGLKKEEQAEHSDYNKLMGMPKLKEQLKSISFLLS